MRDRHARQLTNHGGEFVNDDWVRLGDVVARIAQRLEVTGGPPVARADADLFVLMLTEIYGPLPQGAARRAEGQAGDEA